MKDLEHVKVSTSEFLRMFSKVKDMGEECLQAKDLYLYCELLTSGDPFTKTEIKCTLSLSVGFAGNFPCSVEKKNVLAPLALLCQGFVSHHFMLCLLFFNYLSCCRHFVSNLKKNLFLSVLEILFLRDQDNGSEKKGPLLGEKGNESPIWDPSF